MAVNEDFMTLDGSSVHSNEDSAGFGEELITNEDKPVTSTSTRMIMAAEITAATKGVAACSGRRYFVPLRVKRFG